MVDFNPNYISPEGIENPLAILPQANEALSFSDTFGAMLRTESPLLSWSIQRSFGLTGTPIEDPNFDWAHTLHQRGDYAYHDSLSGAKSEEHYNTLKAKHLYEENQRDVIAQAGIGEALAAGLLTGLVDPLNLAVGIATGTGATLGGAVFRAAASSLLITGFNESALQHTQVNRPLSESIINLAGDMVFSTALGMGAYGIVRGLGLDPNGLRDRLMQEERAANNAYGLPMGGADGAVLYERPWHYSLGTVDVIHRSVESRETDVRKIGTAKGKRYRSAEYDEAENIIYIDEMQLRRDFNAKAWRSPRMKGVDAISHDFKDAREYINFAVMHEFIHSRHQNFYNETLAEYENRVNFYSLLIHRDMEPFRETSTLNLERIRGHAVPDLIHSNHFRAISEKYHPSAAQNMFEEGAFGGKWQDFRDDGGNVVELRPDHPVNYTDGETLPPEKLSDRAEKSGIILETAEEHAARRERGDLSWGTLPGISVVPGLERLKVSPLLNMLNSPFGVSRWLAVNLLETPVALRGFNSLSTPDSIQQKAKIHNYNIAQIVGLTMRAFTEHRIGRELPDDVGMLPTFKTLGAAQLETWGLNPWKPKLDASSSRSINGFKRRVALSLWSKDSDPDPAVAKLVKQIRGTIDEVTREAQKVGLLPETLDLKGSQSYFMRMWHQDLTVSKFDMLTGIITRWQKAFRSEDMPDSLLEVIDSGDSERHTAFIGSQVRNVGRRLNGIEDYSPEYAAPGGSLKERGIWIDDTVLAGDNKEWGGDGTSFLETDIDHVMKRWVNTLAMDIEITKSPIFGDVSMTNVFSKIRKEGIDRAEELGEDIIEVQIDTPQGAPMPPEFVRAIEDEDTFVVGRGEGEPDYSTMPEYDPEGGAILDMPDQPRSRARETKPVGMRKIIVNSTEQAERDIETLTGMRDSMRGTYSLSEDPFALTARMARLSIDMTHLALMGNVMISSIPDIARILVVNRMAAVQTLNLAFNHREAYKIAAKEAMYAGTALDMSLSQTVHSLIHQGEVPRYTGLERGVGRMTDTLFIINGLNPWNAMIKKAAGVATIARMVDDFRQYQAGTLDQRSIRKLNSAGVDGDFMRAMMKKVDAHGEQVGGIDIVNSHLWGDSPEDVALLRRFRAIVNKQVDIQIVTPGPGDIPLMLKKTPLYDNVTEALLGRKMTEREALAFNKETGFDAVAGDRPRQFGKGSRLRREAAALYPEFGKIFGQYKSFIAGSWSRTLLNSSQHADSRELVGIGAGVIVGGMVKTLKDWSYERPGPKNLNDFLMEGFDQAGLGSWAMWANNSAEMLTNNTVGLRPFMGIQDRFAPSARWQMSNIAGPAVGQYMRLFQGVGDIATGQPPHDLVNIAPYQSHFLLRLHNLFNFRETADATLGAGGVQ